MKQSAGTLLYRDGPDGLEVLLVHPSGWYNRGKPWSIPKGLPDPDEKDLADTARRETREETGVEMTGELIPLGSTQYTRSRKEVHAYAGPAPPGATPRCASWEVDGVRFVPLAEARELLHPEQVPFLDRLVEQLKKQGK
jgi:predicted NUDIX family NTP pyrophosphohydrolase